MRKIFLTLCLLSGALLPGGEGALRIADASRAGINALQSAALTLAQESRTAVTVDRVPPREALRRLKAGQADLIVLEHGNLPEKTPAVCRLFAAEVLAVYVHSSNPVKGIKRKELKEILTDKRPNWLSLHPLRQTDIHRYGLSLRAPGDGLGESLLGVENFAQDIFRLNSTREVILLTGSDAESLGIGLLMPDLPPDVRTLRINGVLPLPGTVASGKYLLCWRYYVLAPEKPLAAAGKYLELMKKISFARELEKFGFMAL